MLSVRRVVDVEGAVGCMEESGVGEEVWMEMCTGGLSASGWCSKPGD